MSAKKTRIMYIENKSDGLEGPARIGCVTISKSGRSVFYQGRELTKTTAGFKSNYVDIETGEAYWISGPKKRGGDRLYGVGRVEIDEDVRVEYWTNIRDLPQRVSEAEYVDS